MLCLVLVQEWLVPPPCTYIQIACAAGMAGRRHAYACTHLVREEIGAEGCGACGN